jgi:hypothetical protein
MIQRSVLGGLLYRVFLFALIRRRTPKVIGAKTRSTPPMEKMKYNPATDHM